MSTPSSRAGSPSTNRNSTGTGTSIDNAPPRHQNNDMLDASPPEALEAEHRRISGFFGNPFPPFRHVPGPPLSFELSHATIYTGPNNGGRGRGYEVPGITVTSAEAGDDGEDYGDRAGRWRLHRVSFMPRAPPPTREGLSRAVSPVVDDDDDDDGSLPAPRGHGARFPDVHPSTTHARARYTVVGTVATPRQPESDGSDDRPPPPLPNFRRTNSDLTATATAEALRSTGPPTICAHHHPARGFGLRPPLPTPLEAAALAARAPRAEVEPEAPEEDVQLNEADLLRAIGPEHWEDGLFFFDSSGNIHARSRRPTQQEPHLPRRRGRGPFGYQPPPSPTLQRGEESGRSLPRRRPAVAGLHQLPPEVQRFVRDGEADRFVLTEEEVLRRRAAEVHPDPHYHHHRHHHRGHAAHLPGVGQMHHPAHFDAQNRNVPVDIYGGVPLNWHKAPKTAVEALPTRVLTTADMGEDGKASCGVCTFDVELGVKVTVLPRCKHFFHGDCIKEWLGGYNATCPMCRDEITGAASGSGIGGSEAGMTGPAGHTDISVAGGQPVQSREELDAAYLERRRRRREARAAGPAGTVTPTEER
ncbi:hypothetical protein LTR86_008912 [Recurvomyces mirabilis]|nr:hypothetical protein LTR86_008912 [Recurvomyces mirabilis]